MMVDAGSERGAIDPEEQSFIQNVFEFDDITAGRLPPTGRKWICYGWMRPRSSGTETIRGSRHSMYPLCQESVDQVVGVLNTRTISA